jgi:hypothetical protein
MLSDDLLAGPARAANRGVRVSGEEQPGQHGDVPPIEPLAGDP